MRVQLAGWLVCCALAASAAQADPLRDLPRPSDKGVMPIDETQCGLNKPSHIVGARLIVRNTLRPIGPYVVRLPGYTTADDETPLPRAPGQTYPEGADLDYFAPMELHAKPGDTLRIDLVNQLLDSETVPDDPNFTQTAVVNSNDRMVNLHTHGLIVKPRPYGPCGALGDYIFDDVDWSATAHYRIDIPERIRGAYFNAPKTDAAYQRDRKGPYPAGPYWIHSHLHGLAKYSVLAGQSAFLSVDCPNEKDVNQCPNGATALQVEPKDVKVLALKDIQVLVDGDHTPDKFTTPAPDPHDQTAWFADKLYNTTNCGPVDPSAPPAPEPFCFAPYALGSAPPAVVNAVPSNMTAVVWLFTINGQLHPSLELGPQSPRQLWRIANLSAVATYRLRIVDDQNRPQKIMRVVSVDGVLAGAENGGAPGDFGERAETDEILLTPAARTEIVVDWSGGAADKTLRLINAPFCTSKFNPDGSCGADPYPAVTLADVVMKAAPAVAPKSTNLTAARVSLASPYAFSRRSVEVSPPSANNPANCIAMPKSNFRTIRFEQDQANFFIGPYDAGGATDAEKLKNVRSFRHDSPPGARPHICVESGKTELWLLENNTAELHNFHIHQSKFRLATPKELKERGIEGAVFDPTGLLDKQVSGLMAAFEAESKANGAVWHDTIPVAPAGDGMPGHTAIVIPFDDENQIGTFVYHCHILEHEDGGMMGVVEVYKPGALRVGALTTPTGFCGRPPVGYSPIPTRAASWGERFALSLGL
jgi:FtsP/CotA-like multicopper oxidase with cupredoxin domain